MRVEVDRALCDGNGLCMVEAPEAFRLDDDDNLLVLLDEPGEELRSKVRSAAWMCPKGAIAVKG